MRYNHLSFSVFSLGNGKRLRFWKDVWHRDEALCYSFPSLFSVAANKSVLVADVWEEGGWSPSFTRPFNDWEVVEALSLLLVI